MPRGDPVLPMALCGQDTEGMWPTQLGLYRTVVSVGGEFCPSGGHVAICRDSRLSYLEVGAVPGLQWVEVREADTAGSARDTAKQNEPQLGLSGWKERLKQQADL